MATRGVDPFWSSLPGAILFASMVITLAIVVTPFFLLALGIYAGVRLYRESPARLERLARTETERLHAHALAGRVQLSDAELDRKLSATWPPDMPPALQIQLLSIGRALYEDEGLQPQVPPVPALCNTVEGARYRDQLARLGQARHDRVMIEQALSTISEALAPVAHAAPPIESETLVSIRQFLEPLNRTVAQVIAPFFADSDYRHFLRLKEQLDANLQRTHRTNPVFPSEYRGDDAVGTYLAGTHLRALFDLKTPFAIPDDRRFEHTHLIAGSGHGKTQTLQYFLQQDLPVIARGDRSAVVIDSQGDLINTLLKAEHLPPERIVLIDPEDIEWPVSLNLFSVGQDRLEGYSPLERERLTNSIIELYDFVLGSLLASGMTAKQSVVFRYVTRLMFHIEGATIHTLRELLEPGGSERYREQISALDGTARRFFETEFDGREFASTKTQVLRRLYSILENRTFERMFSNPVSKFDMFTELNAGKLILINTAKALLKEQGTEVFGRFFIALIAQAAQERATMPRSARVPAYVYIDEAQDYFDETLGVILSQARKYKIGITASHQYLGQLGHGLQEAFEANTSIKMAGGVSARDARALASQMNSSPDRLQGLPTGTFATYIRGLTTQAVSLSIPFFGLERGPKHDKFGVEAIRQHSRERYAAPWEATGNHGDSSSEKPRKPAEENDDPDPTAPSPEL